MKLREYTYGLQGSERGTHERLMGDVTVCLYAILIVSREK